MVEAVEDEGGEGDEDQWEEKSVTIMKWKQGLNSRTINTN